MPNVLNTTMTLLKRLGSGLVNGVTVPGTTQAVLARKMDLERAVSESVLSREQAKAVTRDGRWLWMNYNDYTLWKKTHLPRQEVSSSVQAGASNTHKLR